MRGLNARLREQSALCSEVTRRGAAGEGAQGRRLRRRRRDVPRSPGPRGAGMGLRAGLLGGRCGRGGPWPCSPSPEPPPPRSRICYIKSRVGTVRGVAPVAPTQAPPDPPAALDTE